MLWSLPVLLPLTEQRNAGKQAIQLHRERSGERDYLLSDDALRDEKV